MERKTQVRAGNGQQDILISRAFDLPVDLLFKAHTDPELFAEWMTHEYGICKVQKMEAHKNGSWEFHTVDAQNNLLFKASGVFHELITDQKIIRTFEMGNAPFEVQLEFLEFEKLSDDTSQLNMQIVFRSADYRDQMLKLPFAQGLDMAHNRLEKIIGSLQ